MCPTLGYPNRDSSFYGTRYNMPECETVLRGTLRYDVRCVCAIIHLFAWCLGERCVCVCLVCMCVCVQPLATPTATRPFTTPATHARVRHCAARHSPL